MKIYLYNFNAIEFEENLKKKLLTFHTTVPYQSIIDCIPCCIPCRIYEMYGKIEIFLYIKLFMFFIRHTQYTHTERSLCYYNFLFLFLRFLCQFSKLFFNIGLYKCRRMLYCLLSPFQPFLKPQTICMSAMLKDIVFYEHLSIRNQILHKLLHNREPITLHNS